jgi:hypothetical protein
MERRRRAQAAGAVEAWGGADEATVEDESAVEILFS